MIQPSASGFKTMKDLTGQTFGRLTVAWPVGKGKGNRVHWLAFCSCGNGVVVAATHLQTGNTKSCGCLRTTHGHARAGKQTREYRSWVSMTARCTDPNATGYKDYGGRGISVCERWRGERGFENFLADMGTRPEATTLDRFPDKNGNYEPGNCRWATATEQMRNRRTVKLDVPKVIEIRRLAAEGVPQKELSLRFDVANSRISEIVQQKTWKEAA